MWDVWNETRFLVLYRVVILHHHIKKDDAKVQD